MSTFRQKHPIILGLFILTGIFFLFLGGISLLLSSLISNSTGSDFFIQGEGVGIVDLKGIIVSSEQVIKHLTEFRNNAEVVMVI